jgi:hypothetical protein
MIPLSYSPSSVLAFDTMSQRVTAFTLPRIWPLKVDKVDELEGPPFSLIRFHYCVPLAISRDPQ